MLACQPCWSQRGQIRGVEGSTPSVQLRPTGSCQCQIESHTGDGPRNRNSNVCANDKLEFKENYMENLRCFLLPLMIAGLRRPVEAVVMGLPWNVGRVFYALGYTRNGLSNRLGDAVAAIMYRVGYTMPGARNGMGNLVQHNPGRSHGYGY